jgi:hypothetical protein
MDWKLIGTTLGIAVLLIAVFMEVYKKKIRMCDPSPWENYLIAGVLSIILTTLSYFAFTLPGTLWAIPLYAIAVYIVQFVVDMKIVKSLVRWYTKKKGITLEGFDYDE